MKTLEIVLTNLKKLDILLVKGADELCLLQI